MALAVTVQQFVDNIAQLPTRRRYPMCVVVLNMRSNQLGIWMDRNAIRGQSKNRDCAIIAVQNLQKLGNVTSSYTSYCYRSWKNRCVG